MACKLSIFVFLFILFENSVLKMLVLSRQSVRKLFKKATGALPKEVPLESSMRRNDVDGNGNNTISND